MKTVEFDSEFNELVLDYLRANYGKLYFRSWNLESNTLAIFVHDEYVLRTSSDQSITVVFEPSTRQGRTLVTAIASGGRQGLLGIDWGSQSAAEKTFEKRIREITRDRYTSNY